MVTTPKLVSYQFPNVATMAAAAPDIPSTLFSSAVGNCILPPPAQAAIAAADAGRRPQPRYGWHANANPHTMKPYGIRNNEAKAICMLEKNPRKPVRQLLPPPNPPAGAAGDRSDFFPNRPGDVRSDGSRASLIRGWGPAQGMHLQRFSPCGRPTSYTSHSAPAAASARSAAALSVPCDLHVPNPTPKHDHRQEA